LIAIDPFLEKHAATQRSPLERIGSPTAQITVQSFTLPHASKLTKSDRDRGRIGQRMRDGQGFYVYRSRRLIDWGTWFRLTPKEELGKLARVRVDIPNSLDGLWGLDIKKSRAIPPESVRKELRRLVDRIVGQSKSVHQYRGRKDESQADGVFVWQLIQDRESFSYSINREHPLIAEMIERDDSARGSEILSLVEDTFPVHDLYARMAGDTQPAASGFEDTFLLAAAKQMWLRMSPTFSSDFDRFRAAMSSIEPFSLRADANAWLEQQREEITNG